MAKDQKKSHKWILWVILGLFVAITVYGMSTDTIEEQNQEAKTENVEKQKTTEKEAETETVWSNTEDRDGIKVYTMKPDSGISNKYTLLGFGSSIADTLKQEHEQLPNGAIFTLILTFADDYGNEKDEYVSAIYFSSETLEKINYDNWPNKTEPQGIGVMKTADATFITPKILNKGEDSDTEFFDFINKNLESAPEIFSNYQGIIE